MGVRSGILGDCSSSFNTSRSLTKSWKIVKADRNTLHRIVTAFKAGREANMSEILKHELMPVPIAIAETNGSLKSGNKSLLLEILLKNGDTNDLIDFNHTYLHIHQMSSNPGVSNSEQEIGHL
jgi:hypothetical protein